MVFSNRGYPDPDATSNDVSPINEIIMANDTDTEEEDNTAYNGYEPLFTNEISGVSEEDDESDSEDGAAATNEQNLPEITRMEDVLVREVWAGPAPKAVDIEMDKNKVDEVKQAMMNFTLPASAIPEWANNIPEEQWKQQLLKKLQNKRED